MIATGGTGGHVYPALAVAEAMRTPYPETMFYFVGTVGGFERPLLEQAGVDFAAYDEVHAGPIHGVNPFRLVVSLLKLAVGTFQSFWLLSRHKPDAILSTGGWVGLPVALAAWLRRVPLLIYLPDIEPALMIKTLRPFARKVALTVEESAVFFNRDRVVVTGYPLRKHMLDTAARPDRRIEAIRHFGLDPARRTLLVFGGSRGARAINIAVIRILPGLLAGGIQIVHVTGELDWDRSQAQVHALSEVSDLQHYHACAYLHDEMPLALAAADLAVCRAGASVLGEFPLFGLPSILIPLAYSWRYQQVNADYLAERGAAIHLDETRMDDLLPMIRELMADPARLEQMRLRAAALARPDGAFTVAKTLAHLTGSRT